MELSSESGSDQLEAHIRQIRENFSVEDLNNELKLITEAILGENIETVWQAVEIAPECIVTRSQSGAYPIHLACLMGTSDIVEYLLSILEGSVLFETEQGVLPVHVAAYAGSHTICEVLVQANPSTTTLTTRSGHLPEDIARIGGYGELANRLTDVRETYLRSTASTATAAESMDNTNNTNTIVSSPSSKSGSSKKSNLQSITAKYTSPPKSPTSPVSRTQIHIATARAVLSENTETLTSDTTDTFAALNRVIAELNTTHNHNTTDNTSNIANNTISNTDNSNTNNTSSNNNTTNNNNINNNNHTTQSYLLAEFQRASLLEEETDIPLANHHNSNQHNNTNYYTHNYTDFNDHNSITNNIVGMPESLMFNLSDVLSVTAYTNTDQRPYTSNTTSRRPVGSVPVPQALQISSQKPLNKSNFIYKPPRVANRIAQMVRPSTTKTAFSPRRLGTASGERDRPTISVGPPGYNVSTNITHHTNYTTPDAIPNIHLSTQYVPTIQNVQGVQQVVQVVQVATVPSIVITSAGVVSPNARHRAVRTSPHVPMLIQENTIVGATNTSVGGNDGDCVPQRLLPRSPTAHTPRSSPRTPRTVQTTHTTNTTPPQTQPTVVTTTPTNTINPDDALIRDIVPNTLHTTPHSTQYTTPHNNTTHTTHNINTPHNDNNTYIVDAVWASSQDPMYSLHKPKRPASSHTKRVVAKHKNNNISLNAYNTNDTNKNIYNIIKNNVSTYPTRPNTAHTTRTNTTTPRSQRTRSADAQDVLQSRPLLPNTDGGTSDNTNYTDNVDTTPTTHNTTNTDTLNTTHTIHNTNATDTTTPLHTVYTPPTITYNTHGVTTSTIQPIVIPVPRLNIGDNFPTTSTNNTTFDLKSVLQPYLHYYEEYCSDSMYDDTNNTYVYNTSCGTNTSVHNAFIPSSIFRSKHSNDIHSPAYKQRMNLSQMVQTTERIVSDPHYTPPVLPLPILHSSTNTTPRSARYDMYTEFSYIPAPRRPKTGTNKPNTPSTLNKTHIVVPTIHTVNSFDGDNVDTKSADYSA